MVVESCQRNTQHAHEFLHFLQYSVFIIGTENPSLWKNPQITLDSFRRFLKICDA